MYDASLIVKCNDNDMGDDDDIGDYDHAGEDGDIGEVDEVGGSYKVSQLLWSSTTLSCLLHNC